MYLCYIDESGTSDIPGNSSHFILAGLSIPIWKWSLCENEISGIKRKYNIENSEIHTAWMLRKYLEQSKIESFQSLSYPQRKTEVLRFRNQELLKLQKSSNNKGYRQTKKNYKKTEDYIHLTFLERKQLIKEIAKCVSNWGFARLFAECIDKVFFTPYQATRSVDEQAFEQVVSRYEQYLQNINKNQQKDKIFGLLIHDNNDTIARKHTSLMLKFHKNGTLWTEIKNVVETPLFVDSKLTSMVQIADLCAYSIRRYIENNENELFDLIFERADRKDGIIVGVRHFTKHSCECKICSGHNKSKLC